MCVEAWFVKSSLKNKWDEYLLVLSLIRCMSMLQVLLLPRLLGIPYTPQACGSSVYVTGPAKTGHVGT